MGQKVSPHGLRVGIIKDWSSTWYANKQDFSANLVEDHKIREYLKNLLKPAGINKLNISRKGNLVKVDIYAAKPGMIIGKGGAAIEELKAKCAKKGLDFDAEEAKYQAKQAEQRAKAEAKKKKGVKK